MQYTNCTAMCSNLDVREEIIGIKDLRFTVEKAQGVFRSMDENRPAWIRKCGIYTQWNITEL